MTEADFADATLVAASKSDSNVNTFAPDPATSAEKADDLLQHVDTLKETFAEVFAEPTGLPPDRGVEHVVPLLLGSQPPFQRMYSLALSAKCKFADHLQRLVARAQNLTIAACKQQRQYAQEL